LPLRLAANRNLLQWVWYNHSVETWIPATVLVGEPLAFCSLLS